MFESLEEVVEQWQLRYKALDMSFNLLPDIGYSEEDINRLENHVWFQSESDSLAV